jgi:hypothetical protein
MNELALELPLMLETLEIRVVDVIPLDEDVEVIRLVEPEVEDVEPVVVVDPDVLAVVLELLADRAELSRVK